jgi:hypothetical protein
VNEQQYYVDIYTAKAEPCLWGAWNQYLIFRLLDEGLLDLVRVVGPVKTVAQFLRSEGYTVKVNDIRPLA